MVRELSWCVNSRILKWRPSHVVCPKEEEQEGDDGNAHAGVVARGVRTRQAHGEDVTENHAAVGKQP